MSYFAVEARAPPPGAVGARAIGGGLPGVRAFVYNEMAQSQDDKYECVDGPHSEAFPVKLLVVGNDADYADALLAAPVAVVCVGRRCSSEHAYVFDENTDSNKVYEFVRTTLRGRERVVLVDVHLLYESLDLDQMLLDVTEKVASWCRDVTVVMRTDPADVQSATLSKDRYISFVTQHVEDGVQRDYAKNAAEHIYDERGVGRMPVHEACYAAQRDRMDVRLACTLHKKIHAKSAFYGGWQHCLNVRAALTGMGWKETWLLRPEGVGTKWEEIDQPTSRRRIVANFNPSNPTPDFRDIGRDECLHTLTEPPVYYRPASWPACLTTDVLSRGVPLAQGT